MLEHTPPLLEFDNIIFYIRNIFSYDPNNIDAAIALAYMYIDLHHYSKVPDYLFNKLRRIHSDNAEKAAMLEIARAWAYQSRDIDTYIKCLEKSIELDPSFASHYLQLGKHYIHHEQQELGAYFLKSGLKNVKLIYPDDYTYDVTDIEEFFNEDLKEIHMTSSLHNYYLDLIDRGPKVWEDFRNL